MFQVKRFQGRVMAITGYEVDQVTWSRNLPSSTLMPRSPMMGKSRSRSMMASMMGRRRSMAMMEKEASVASPVTRIAAEETSR